MPVVRKMRHGLSRTRLYYVWLAMKRRCDNKNVEQYKNYGARGISVCPQWQNDFLTFRKWALENGYDENASYGECTIDRVNVDGDYSPENCRWISTKLQQNNRRNNHILEYNGERKTLSEWEDAKGIKQLTLRARIEANKEPFVPVQQTKILTYNGQSLTVKEWASLLGLSPSIIYRRIKQGLSLNNILSKNRRRLSNE